MKIDPSLVSVRDFNLEDIPFVLNYWYRSSPEFLESMGVDLKKLPQENDMREALKKRLFNNQNLERSKLNALAILYNGQAIGFHTLVPVKEGESGIFHAHIWEPSMRRMGIGFYSYVQALRVFMARFNLQKVIFKTPAQNLGAIRVKEKLGIRCIGEEKIDFDIIKEGTLGIVFELTREEALSKWGPK